MTWPLDEIKLEPCSCELCASFGNGGRTEDWGRASQYLWPLRRDSAFKYITDISLLHVVGLSRNGERPLHQEGGT